MGSLADEVLHAFEFQSVFHEDIGKVVGDLEDSTRHALRQRV